MCNVFMMRIVDKKEEKGVIAFLNLSLAGIMFFLTYFFHNLAGSGVNEIASVLAFLVAAILALNGLAFLVAGIVFGRGAIQ